MKKEKVLYFEGAGVSYCDVSKNTVGNCRIRTAFHLDNGKRVYLEIIGIENKRKKQVESVRLGYVGYVPYLGVVDSCHYITGDPNDCNNNRISIDGSFGSLERNDSNLIDYSFNGILNFVNSLGCSFDRIEVLPDLAGYRVFKDIKGGEKDFRNYGDEFIKDSARLEKREKIYNFIREYEKNRGEKSICFSLWTDEKDPDILHYCNFRKGGFKAIEYQNGGVGKETTFSLDEFFNEYGLN